MSNKSYLCAFAATPLGRSVAANAHDGELLGLHGRSFVRRAIREAYGVGALPTHKEFVQRIEDLAAPKVGTLGGKSRRGRKERLSGRSVCTVLPLGVIEGCARPVEDIDRFTTLTHRFCDFSDETWIERLALLPRKERYFRLKPGVRLGRNFLWFTPQAVFDRTMASDLALGTAADRCRDLLGLAHRVPRDPVLCLVALSLPLRIVRAATHFRPTFVDAGSHGRFSARSHGMRNHECWGRTVDLGSIGGGSGLASGLRERVCRPIEDSMFLPSEVIRFTVLGIIRTSPAGTDDHFSRALANGRTDAALAAVLGG